jgi:hypothetical protein
MIGSYLGHIVDRLTRTGTTLNDAVLAVFDPESKHDPHDLAINCVLAHAVLGRFEALLDGPMNGQFMRHQDLLDALRGALMRPDPQEAQEAMVALVAREAAARLGDSRPSEDLLRRVRERIGGFYALATEARRLACGEYLLAQSA